MGEGCNVAGQGQLYSEITITLQQTLRHPNFRVTDGNLGAVDFFTNSNKPSLLISETHRLSKKATSVPMIFTNFNLPCLMR